MQACGISLLRLARPVILVSIVGAAATAYEVIVALPDANQTFREIAFGLVKEQVETKIKPRVFFHELPNRVIYVQRPGGAAVGGTCAADTTQAEQTTVYFASEGRIVVDREKSLVLLRPHGGRAIRPSAASPKLTMTATSRRPRSGWTRRSSSRRRRREARPK